MTDVFTYIVDLPDGIHEIVTKCSDGYTIYLHAGDTSERQREAYRHAIKHIMERDYEKADVQIIEFDTHKAG